MNFSPTELFIILLIVLLLFGAGRVARVGKEMGTAIREFRKGLQGEEEAKNNPTNDQEKTAS